MLDDTIAHVRQSSRQMVRELGMLASQFEGTGLSSSQCHLIVELDIRGEETPGRLADLLRLDPSTVTRIVQPLVSQGWIVSERDGEDGRRQILRLTKEGKAQAKAIHDVSNNRVRSALGMLPPEEHSRILEGLDAYSNALRRARMREGITLRTILPEDNRQMAKLIRQTLDEFGICGPGTSQADEEIDCLFETYSQPRHVYYVVAKGSTVLGGGGIGPLNGGSRDTCELRKMYLKPETRGLRLGHDLLQACLSAAKSLLYRRCYLETMRHMHKARELYLRFGFQECDGPQGQTGHTKCDAWFVREL